MSPELEKIFFEKYPALYKKDILPFGIECGDGWFMLIDQLSQHIDSYRDSNNVPPVTVTQVKEKFGGLRFYITGGDNFVDGLIAFAETLSYKICENCGTTFNVGKTSGWIQVLCQDCAKKQKKENWKLGE